MENLEIMENKDINDSHAFRIVTKLSEFKECQELFKAAMENAIYNLEECDKDCSGQWYARKKKMELYQLKINIYANLYYLAINSDNYLKYINYAYSKIYKVQEAKNPQRIKRIDRKLNKIVGKED